MKSLETSGAELASVFEQMMQQLLLLGHTLPQSAVSFTPQQLKILFTLDFLGEPSPMSKLSLRLGVTPGTLTKTAAGLIRRDFLERQRSPSDDRVVKISLSQKGRRVVSQIKKYRQQFFSKLCQGLTLMERRRLIESHRHILETYRQILQGAQSTKPNSNAKAPTLRVKVRSKKVARSVVKRSMKSAPRGPVSR